MRGDHTAPQDTHRGPCRRLDGLDGGCGEVFSDDTVAAGVIDRSSTTPRSSTSKATATASKAATWAASPTPTAPRMRDASDHPARDISRCECCGRDTVTAVEGLFSNPKPGSPRRFCSPEERRAVARVGNAKWRRDVVEHCPVLVLGYD